MWNRRRISIVLAALACIALAGYFEPMHGVRGWLHGEAFYDGRPTSYWRSRIDRWMEKYDTPQVAARNLWMTPNGVEEFNPYLLT